MAFGAVQPGAGRLAGWSASSVLSAYMPQNRTGSALETAGTEEQRGDVVELSASAPKPLPAGLFEAALRAGQSLSDPVSSPLMPEHLRADRVFAAVATLTAMGLQDNPATTPPDWPGGLPAPTDAEMQAAYRRLTQRLQMPDGGPEPAGLRDVRLDLVDALRENFG